MAPLFPNADPRVARILSPKRCWITCKWAALSSFIYLERESARSTDREREGGRVGEGQSEGEGERLNTKQAPCCAEP